MSSPDLSESAGFATILPGPHLPYRCSRCSVAMARWRPGHCSMQKRDGTRWDQLSRPYFTSKREEKPMHPGGRLQASWVSAQLKMGVCIWKTL